MESGSVWSIIKVSAIGAIVTAIVGAGIAWLTGWLPAFWSAVMGVLAWLWSVSTYLIPVPLILVAIASVPFIVWFWRHLRHMRNDKRAEVVHQPAQSEIPLTDLQDKLLRLLARADGRYIQFDRAASSLNTSRLLVEQAAEILENRGLIDSASDVIHGSHLGLTRAGRDFVIEKGMPLGNSSGFR